MKISSVISRKKYDFLCSLHLIRSSVDRKLFRYHIYFRIITTIFNKVSLIVYFIPLTIPLIFSSSPFPVYSGRSLHSIISVSISCLQIILFPVIFFIFSSLFPKLSVPALIALKATRIFVSSLVRKFSV